MQKPRRAKPYAIAWLCLLLMGCSSDPVYKIKTVTLTPEPAWMADCEIPARDGETLGAYYHWSAALYGALLECNVRQSAEREWAATQD